jgi:hypothetical protein
VTIEASRRCLSWALVLAAAPASADPFSLVTFNDPGARNAAYYSGLDRLSRAAGDRWAPLLPTLGTLEIEIAFSTTVPRATGRSVTSWFVTRDGPWNVFEQGAAAELRTGIDPNGARPDVEFVFNPDYLSTLWFDPDPYTRTAPVPGLQVDAMSVLLHEFGHALAFNGWRDPSTGSIGVTGAISTFDRATKFDDDGAAFFIGLSAMAVYGGPVPLTVGNYVHVGNEAPRLGAGLIGDLMNGVTFYTGTRYDISPLDAAVLHDVGIAAPDTHPIPEPSTLSLAVIGMTGVAIAAYRRRRHH